MFRQRQGTRPERVAKRRVNPVVWQLRRLFGFLQPYRWQLAVGVGAVMIPSDLTLALPALSRDLFDQMFAARDQLITGANLNRIALILIAIFLTQATFNFVRVYYLSLVGEGVVADLRKAL